MERQLSVLDEAGEFSTTAPFASSAELVSPSGLTLSSPQFKTACLGAYTKVSQVSERQNKSASGQKGTKSEWKRVGEYWNQVDDFRVVRVRTTLGRKKYDRRVCWKNPVCFPLEWANINVKNVRFVPSSPVVPY